MQLSVKHNTVPSLDIHGPAPRDPSMVHSDLTICSYSILTKKGTVPIQNCKFSQIYENLFLVCTELVLFPIKMIH